jgi:hypothetical protein
MGERRSAYRGLVGKPDGMRPVGKPRRRWYNNIKTDLQKKNDVDVYWIDLAQDRDNLRTLLNPVMNLKAP